MTRQYVNLAASSPRSAGAATGRLPREPGRLDASKAAGLLCGMASISRIVDAAGFGDGSGPVRDHLDVGP